MTLLKLLIQLLCNDLDCQWLCGTIFGCMRIFVCGYYVLTYKYLCKVNLAKATKVCCQPCYGL